MDNRIRRVGAGAFFLFLTLLLLVSHCQPFSSLASGSRSSQVSVRIPVKSPVAAVTSKVFQRPSQCASIGCLFLVAPTTILVDGDLVESIKRSASDRLGNLVPQVRARTFPGFFTTWRF